MFIVTLSKFRLKTRVPALQCPLEANPYHSAGKLSCHLKTGAAEFRNVVYHLTQIIENSSIKILNHYHK
jgi:hypothetical protein